MKTFKVSDLVDLLGSLPLPDPDYAKTVRNGVSDEPLTAVSSWSESEESERKEKE